MATPTNTSTVDNSLEIGSASAQPKKDTLEELLRSLAEANAATQEEAPGRGNMLFERRKALKEQHKLKEMQDQAEKEKDTSLAKGMVLGSVYKAKGAREKLKQKHQLPQKKERLEAELQKEKLRKDALAEKLGSDLAAQQARKDQAMRNFASQNAQIEKAFQDAHAKASNRLNELNSKISAVQAKDPSRPIFGSSLGIAAAMIGALRQGLFGGQNNAYNLLKEKVERAAMAQMNSLKSLQVESGSAKRVLDGIVQQAESDKEALDATKQAIISDVKAQIGNIMKNYKLELDQNQAVELADAVYDLSANIVEQEASEQARLASTTITGARAVNELNKELRESRAATTDIPPTKEEIKRATKLQEDVESAAGSLQGLADTIDALKRMNPSVFGRITATGLRFIPEFLRTASQTEMDMLKAQFNQILFEKLRETQQRISDQDRQAMRGWVGSIKGDPEAVAKRFEKLVGDTTNRINHYITQAADIRLYPSEAGKQAIIAALPSHNIFGENSTARAVFEPHSILFTNSFGEPLGFGRAAMRVPEAATGKGITEAQREGEDGGGWVGKGIDMVGGLFRGRNEQ